MRGAEVPNKQGWGKVSIGQQVTNKGRHIEGEQPIIVGELIRFEPLTGIAVVRCADGSERRRSTNNLRLAQSGD
jgi:hypothetical protein